MTPKSGTLLVNEVVPRLKSSIPGSVRLVGSDDVAELVQDGTAIAAGLLHSAEVRGKEVSAGNLAFYAVQQLKTGRRSTGIFKNDAMNPAAQLSGNSRIHSLDEPVAGEEGSEESLTLGDTLADRADDPASEAGRRLDWEQLIMKLDGVAGAILHALADGQELTKLVPRLGLSRSTLQNNKHRLAGLIREFLGPDILILAQQRPGWVDGIQATRERSNCRWERQAA